MDIQQILTLALPLIAMLLSYGLQQAHWNNRINTLIATGTVLLASIATLWIQHKFTGNLYGDIGYVLATATALQAESFAPLQRYLRSNFPIATQGLDASKK